MIHRITTSPQHLRRQELGTAAFECEPPAAGLEERLCFRSSMFSGNSSSRQSTTNNQIGLEGSGQVGDQGSAVAQDDGIAVSGELVGGDKFTLSGNSVSGELNFGFTGEDTAKLLRELSANNAETIRVTLGGQSDQFANALGKVESLSETKQTEGFNLLIKNVTWLVIAGLAVLALYLSRKR